MIQIQKVSSDNALAAARDLIREHLEANSHAHDAASTAAKLAALPAPYVPPAGGIWLAWDGAEPAGCVALHALTPEIAEVKRMYVRPESRRRGIARELGERVIAEAREPRACDSAHSQQCSRPRISTRVWASRRFRRTVMPNSAIRCFTSWISAHQPKEHGSQIQLPDSGARSIEQSNAGNSRARNVRRRGSLRRRAFLRADRG